MDGADAAQTPNRQRYEVRNAITVISARTQLLNKQLARGDSPEQLRAHFTAIDVALARLTQALDGPDDARRGDPPA